jgi:hypothetical protein
MDRSFAFQRAFKDERGLIEAQNQLELTRVRNRWTRYDLIVIDELGYVVMPDAAAEVSNRPRVPLCGDIGRHNRPGSSVCNENDWSASGPAGRRGPDVATVYVGPTRDWWNYCGRRRGMLVDSPAHVATWSAESATRLAASPNSVSPNLPTTLAESANLALGFET